MARKKKDTPWKARIDMMDGYAIVATKDRDGNLISKSVALDALAGALAGIPISSGRLPPNTLFYTQAGATLFIGVYVPPAVTTLRTPSRAYRVPLPALVFAGHGRSYELYALAEAGWPGDSAVLHYPPLPNIFNNATICQGEMSFPACTVDSIWDVWEQNVIGSYFTGHLQSDRTTQQGSIFDVWEKLDNEQAERFPRALLVPMKPGVTLGQLAGRHS